VFGWSDESCARTSLFICETLTFMPPPPSPTPPEELRYYFNPNKASFTTNTTYMLYNQPLPFFKAMQFCADAGGYLTVYNSLLEQREVERYFIGQGVLGSARYAANYWIGYRVISTWPNFVPVNPTKGHTHWGTYQVGPGGLLHGDAAAAYS
jgi:hypothetical protein